MSSKLNCIEQRKKVQDHRRDGTFELANQTEDLEVDGMPTNTSRLSSNCHQLPLDLVIKLSKCDFGYVLPKQLFNFWSEAKGGLVNEDAIITMSNASIGEFQEVMLEALLKAAESKMATNQQHSHDLVKVYDNETQRIISEMDSHEIEFKAVNKQSDITSESPGYAVAAARYVFKLVSTDPIAQVMVSAHLVTKFKATSGGRRVKSDDVIHSPVAQSNRRRKQLHFLTIYSTLSSMRLLFIN